MIKKFIELLETREGATATTGVIFRGAVRKVSLFGHLKAFEIIAEGDDEMIKYISEGIENLNEHAKDCERAIDIGEHPEWHNYDMAESKWTSDIMDRFYKKGAVRFYIYENGNINFSCAHSGYEKIKDLVIILKDREDVGDIHMDKMVENITKRFKL